MNEPEKAKVPDEQALLKLYMELTGSSEAAARAVVIHTCYPAASDADSVSIEQTRPAESTPPEPPTK